MRTATNPTTGERIVELNGQWVPFTRSATDKNGRKAFETKDGWIIPDEPMTVGGIAAEGGKGVVRGVEGVGQLAKRVMGAVPGVGPAINYAGERIGNALGIDKLRQAVQPNPENEAETIAGRAGELTGAGLAGGGVAGGLRGMLAQPVAGTLGALGGATAEKAGLGEAGKVAGEIAGSVAGPAGLAKLGRGVKAWAAGDAAKNLKEAEKLGIPLSVGQASDRPFFHGLENLAAKFPGGATVMRHFMNKQQKVMGDLAKTNTSAEEAGRAVERGGKAWMSRMSDKYKRLDARAQQLVPDSTLSFPSTTLQKFDDLLKPKNLTPAEAATWQGNPKIQALRDRLSEAQRTQGGQLSIGFLRNIREEVGNLLDDALSSGGATSQFKALYKTLSDDIGQALSYNGAASAAHKAAQKTWATRMDRVENVFEKIMPKGSTPEAIFNTLRPKNSEQFTTFRKAMRSLNGAERKTVTDAMVNRMGRATKGRQDVTGEKFSSETFLSNWVETNKKVKEVMFQDPKMRESLDTLAKVTSNIREGGGIFSNLSGTAGSFAAYAVYLAPLVAISTGSLAPVTSAIKAVIGAHVGARMLTSPRVVKWLAQPIKNSPGAKAAHLAKLAEIYRDTDDPKLKEELAGFVNKINEGTVK